MCIGIPMRVLRHEDDSRALCVGRGGERRISMLLLDPPPEGSWVLVHLDTARQVLTDDEADHIDRALDALDAVLSGGDVDHLFPDLAGREPRLPPHLRKDGR